MNIVFINLNRAKDRNNNMINYFTSNNINYTRIEAIDGVKLFNDEEYRVKISNLLDIPINKLNPDYFMIKSNFMCLEREIDIIMNKVACNLSHFYATKIALDHNWDNILIFEDDIIFNENFNLNLSNIPENCDILYLGGNIRTFKNDPDYNQKKQKKFINIDTNYIKVLGCQGYYLPNLLSIKKIFSLYSRCFIEGKPRKKNTKEPNRVLMCITDVMYSNYIQTDGNCYLLNPSIIKHNLDFSSTISYKPSYIKSMKNHVHTY